MLAWEFQTNSKDKKDVYAVKMQLYQNFTEVKKSKAKVYLNKK